MPRSFEYKQIYWSPAGHPHESGKDSIDGLLNINGKDGWRLHTMMPWKNEQRYYMLILEREELT